MYEIKQHKQISGISVPLSDTFTNLFESDGLTNFDESILLGHNNHNLLQHLTLNTGGVVIPTDTGIEYKKDTPDNAICLGACLVYNINNVSGMYSVKDNKSTYQRTYGLDDIGNCRFVLTDNNFNYNDVFLYARYLYVNPDNGGTYLDTVVNEDHKYITISPTVYSKTNRTLLDNLKVMIFFKTNDNIIGSIVNVRFFTATVGDWEYRRYFSPNIFVSIGNFDSSKLSGTNPDENDVSFVRYRYSVQGYIRNFIYNIIKSTQMVAMMNATGFYYITGDIPTTQTDFNNNVKIGYMDSDRNIDAYHTLTGINEINNSDTANKDLNNLPEWKPARKDIDTIENMIDNVIYNYSASPFTKYYKVSKNNLKALSTAITTNTPEIPEGLNVFDNIVSVCAFPFDVSTYCRNPISDTIKIYNWDSLINALRIDTQATNQTLTAFQIDRYYNDFRDFPPYTDYRIFLPLYGVYELPRDCVGRTVKITQNSDIVNKAFNYIISVGGPDNFAVIDKLKIVSGAECDFIAINKSIKDISILQNALSVGNSIISGVASVASGNVFGVASSITGVASSVVDINTTKNKSYTYHTSTNNSISDLLDVSSIYLITVRQRYIDIDPHTVGYIYNKRDKIANHSGYCLCSNVDINGNMTSEEKQQIKKYLENGFHI